MKQIVFLLLAAGLVVTSGFSQAQLSNEGLSRGMSSHGGGGGLSSGSSTNGGLNGGLSSSGMNSSWGSESSEGGSASAGRGNMEIQLSPTFQQAATSQGPRQNPLSYCYYNNRSYTDGAKLNGQVCVRPGRSSDGSTTLSSAPTPMRWIPAAQYTRGKY